MLSEIYSPKGMDDIIGQKQAIDSFTRWHDSWRPGGKAALLAGPPGSGKTSLVQAFARERGLDVIEVNASDKRNSSSLQETVGQSSKQMSLFMRGKIILLDEVDGLSGNQDRGAAAELNKIIKNSSFPIVMTANDAYNPKLRTIRTSAEFIKFSKVNSLSVAAMLRRVCSDNGIEIEKDCARSLAMMAGGDMRSALNDLNTVIHGRDRIDKKDLDSLGFRDKEADVFELMKIVFKTSTAKTSIQHAYGTDKDPDEIFWWIEENIPLEYEKPHEIAKAYEWLSGADEMRARVFKNQNYRFRKYMVDMMCAGVAMSKDEMYRKFSRYQGPKRLQRMAQSRSARQKRKEICEILKPHFRTSSATIVSDYFPLMRQMIKAGRTEELTDRYGLVDEDLKFIAR